MKKKRIKRVVPHKYTEEQRQFICDFAFGHSHKEITDAFNEKFGTALEVSQIKGSLKRYGVTTGRTGQFPKGHVPANKGKKMPPDVYEKCKDTMFKKGQNCRFKRPVGSERITRDGFTEVKIAEPNKWALKHRVVWEKENGTVPDGCVVIFLDGNQQNFDINNLKCISMAENLYLNRYKLRFEDRELTDTSTNIAKLQTSINKAKKGERK